MSHTAEEKNGVLATYLGWTIKQTGDGIICLDPNGSHCLPGGCTHDSVKDAKKSIHHYILAQGNVHLFWLLCGQAGWDLYASQGSDTYVTGVRVSYVSYVSKRDNERYEPTYEYRHVTRVLQGSDLINLLPQVAGGPVTALSIESALALSNLLRRTAIDLLEEKQRKG